LYLIVAHSVLPQRYYDIELRGKNGTAVVFDNDDRFDTAKLFVVMKHLVQQKIHASRSRLQSDTLDDEAVGPEKQHSPSQRQIGKGSIEFLVKDCLQHVQIVRPQSWSSFVATVDELPAHLIDENPSHKSSKRPVASIIVDGTSAFFWQRRTEEQDGAIFALESKSNPESNQHVPRYEGLIGSLRSLGARFECPVILTTLQESFTSHGLNPEAGLVAANTCLFVERAPIRLIPPSLSFLELADLQSARQEAVEKHEFVVRNGRESVRLRLSDHGMTVPIDTQEYVT
jgi:hypothetical protein